MPSDQQLPASGSVNASLNRPEFAARRKRRTAALLGLLVLGMVGLSFAAVPLYRLFCQVAGYGGTTQVATEAPEHSERMITVRFDANVAAKMGWAFSAPEPVDLALGETGLAAYSGRNSTTRPILGTATYNVTQPRPGSISTKSSASVSPSNC